MIRVLYAVVIVVIFAGWGMMIAAQLDIKAYMLDYCDPSCPTYTGWDPLDPARQAHEAAQAEITRREAAAMPYFYVSMVGIGAMFLVFFLDVRQRRSRLPAELMATSETRIRTSGSHNDHYANIYKVNRHTY